MRKASSGTAHVPAPYGPSRVPHRCAPASCRCAWLHLIVDVNHQLDLGTVPPDALQVPVIRLGRDTGGYLRATQGLRVESCDARGGRCGQARPVASDA